MVQDSNGDCSRIHSDVALPASLPARCYRLVNQALMLASSDAEERVISFPIDTILLRLAANQQTLTAQNATFGERKLIADDTGTVDEGILDLHPTYHSLDCANLYSDPHGQDQSHKPARRNGWRRDDPHHLEVHQGQAHPAVRRHSARLLRPRNRAPRRDQRPGHDRFGQCDKEVRCRGQVRNHHA